MTFGTELAFARAVDNALVMRSRFAMADRRASEVGSSASSGGMRRSSRAQARH